jgi:hypothetical protein
MCPAIREVLGVTSFSKLILAMLQLYNTLTSVATQAFPK